jgi:hypothetical protein
MLDISGKAQRASILRESSVSRGAEPTAAFVARWRLQHIVNLKRQELDALRLTMHRWELRK